MKSIIKKIVFSSILLVSLNSQASSLIATQVPGIGSDDFYTSGFSVLNNDVVVYVDSSDFFKKKVIAYNLKTLTSEVIHTEPEKTDFTVTATSDRIFSDGSVVYFVVDGDLYFSDGTAAGTKFVDSYGIYLQKQGNRPQILSGKVINQIFYFTYSPEQIQNPCCGFFPENPFLWRTDGTKSGTVQYTNSDGTRQIGDSFIQDGYDSDILFFFKSGPTDAPSNPRTELWKTSAENSTVLVKSFYEEEKQSVDTFTTKVIQNSRGSYFCTFSSDFGPTEGITKLWRVSNSGIVDFLTRDCSRNSQHEFKDNIYFKSNEGLRYTSGVLGDINTVYASDIAVGRDDIFCEIDNKLYASINTNSQILILGISATDDYTILMEKPRITDNEVSITHCFEEKFITYETKIAENRQGGQHWLIDPKNNEKERIASRSTRPLSEIFFGRGYRDLRAPNKEAIEFCAPLFCIVDGSKLAFPMILNLLMDEEESY